ncbi:MAG TPA: LD-carboxypeptidase [Rhizomicrobium sp.]|nr:LD-carboxypeptidase [Rhizomicrobium sp.]
MKIGIVAPASRLGPDMADRVTALARTHFASRAELVFHPQCFLTDGHFAGDDGARAAALADVANDPAIDAVWFARGGYGSCRILPEVLPKLGPRAREKLYLGYSDLGSLLAGLHSAGIRRLAHGPMPADIIRKGGEAAVLRALSYLVDKDKAALEPHVKAGTPHAAFNLTILSHLIGTPWQPDLAGHVLMVEDVSEHMYRIDRALFHVTSNEAMRKIAGLRLGRVSDVLPNEPEFGKSEEDVAQHWCRVSGIAYLGRADIGHDADNKVVPFGA